MIGVAVYKTTPWWQNLAFSWFDIALVALLIFGYWRGRKRGMSREFLPVLYWIAVAVGGAAGYSILGDQLLTGSLVKSVYGKNFTARAEVFFWSYVLIMVVIYLIFAILSRALKAKLEGSNAFGSGEYYLGMIAGIVRYACMIVVALALLHAPHYTATEIANAKAYKNATYGAGLSGYSGDYIPDFAEVQASVFKNSLAGPLIENHLDFALINSLKPVKKSGAAR
jgi:uncharacterized membrane protein required for colicin V production